MSEDEIRALRDDGKLISDTAGRYYEKLVELDTAIKLIEYAKTHNLGEEVAEFTRRTENIQKELPSILSQLRYLVTTAIDKHTELSSKSQTGTA